MQMVPIEYVGHIVFLLGCAFGALVWSCFGIIRERREENEEYQLRLHPKAYPRIVSKSMIDAELRNIIRDREMPPLPPAEINMDGWVFSTSPKDSSDHKPE